MLSLQRFLLALLAALSVLLPSARAEEPKMKVLRYALLIGANDGGDQRVKLRYALSDTTSVAEVLEQFGGVSERDRILLLEPDRATLEKGFSSLKALVVASKSKDARVEVLVYYSGHSDEEGLLLGNERFNYSELKTWISAIPSDVKIVILDSCASGAFTRTKGGVKRPPFLSEDTTKIKGYAFLASSAEDEAAQESDKISASFFTYFLLSGLRGIADVNGDSRVTLNEAYQFAYQETLERTVKTRSGPQHPAYDIQLAGTGDLVMTDLRSASAGVVFSSEIEGRIFISLESGRLIVETSKISGQPVGLGLEPGNYQVALESKGVLSQASVQLQKGDNVKLNPKDFSLIPLEATRTRGDEPSEEAAEALGPSSAPSVDLSLMANTKEDALAQGKYLAKKQIYKKTAIVSGSLGLAFGGLALLYLNGAIESTSPDTFEREVDAQRFIRFAHVFGAASDVFLVGAALSGSAALINKKRAQAVSTQVTLTPNGGALTLNF